MRRKKQGLSKYYGLIGATAGVAAGYFIYKKYFSVAGLSGVRRYFGVMPNMSTFPQFNSNPIMAQNQVRQGARVELMRSLMRREPKSPHHTAYKIMPNGMSQQQFRSWSKYLASRRKPTTWKHYAPNTLALAFPTAEGVVL